MGDIIEASQLLEADKVYLKKDIFGWRVVDPWKNPETGKINWFNFITGGKRNLAILIGLIIFAGILYGAFHEQVSNYLTVMKNPCAYCHDCQEQVRNMLGGLSSQGTNIVVPNFTIVK